MYPLIHQNRIGHSLRVTGFGPFWKMFIQKKKKVQNTVFCFWLLLVWFREMGPHYVALADLELYVEQASLKLRSACLYLSRD